MPVITPCPMDCPKRDETCHATCKTYRAAWEANMRRYDEAAKQRRLNDIIDRSVRENRKKTGKKTPKY